jgi:hypothetical protein
VASGAKLFSTDIEVRKNRLYLPAEKQLPIDFLCLQEIVRLDVDRVGKEMQLWPDLDEVASDVGDFVDYQAMRR